MTTVRGVPAGAAVDLRALRAAARAAGLSAAAALRAATSTGRGVVRSKVLKDSLSSSAFKTKAQ